MKGREHVRKLFESIHAAAAALWLGAAAMSGVVAAITFPLMRNLRPTSAAYAAYEGSHADLLAGQVASRIFWVADAVGLGGAIVTILCVIVLVLSGGLRLARISSGVRLLALGAALVALAYQLFVLGPRMYENLRAYWAAAERGDTPAAEQFRQAFAADHSSASTAIGAMTIAALVGGGGGGGGGGEQAGEPEEPSRYPEPELARTAR